MPLYTRVTFTHRPYAEALAIGDQQAAIMDQIMTLDAIKDIWDSDEVEKEILNLIDTYQNKRG